MQQIDMFLHNRLRIKTRPGKEKSSTTVNFRLRRQSPDYIPKLLGEFRHFRLEDVSSRCEHCGSCDGGLVLMRVEAISGGFSFSFSR
jgi:hypothetical protein